MNTTTTTLRNADLATIAERLEQQHLTKHDLIVPTTRISAHEGQVIIQDGATIINESGVTSLSLHLTPGQVMRRQMAIKLDAPNSYLEKLRTKAETDDTPPRWLELWDLNINTALKHQPPTTKYLVRTFTEPNAVAGFGRALLSDRYAITDNLDVLMATLDGIKQAGADVDITGADLTESSMRVRICAPQVKAYAQRLLDGYKSPYSAQTAADNPTVFAGLVISNNEVGDGTFSIVPRLVVQICSNGMTMTKDALRQVHLGARLDEGVIQWGDDTHKKNVELVTMKARDAVATFLNVDYMNQAIERLTLAAGKPITKPDDTIEHVKKKLAWTDSEREGILNFFIKGGQLTAGGLMQATSAYAQQVDNPDRAAFLEDTAVDVMALIPS